MSEPTTDAAATSPATTTAAPAAEAAPSFGGGGFGGGAPADGGGELPSNSEQAAAQLANMNAANALLDDTDCTDDLAGVLNPPLLAPGTVDAVVLGIEREVDADNAKAVTTISLALAKAHKYVDGSAAPVGAKFKDVVRVPTAAAETLTEGQRTSLRINKARLQECALAALGFKVESGPNAVLNKTRVAGKPVSAFVNRKVQVRLAHRADRDDATKKYLDVKGYAPIAATV